MTEPYQALGLVPTMRGIRHRDEIKTNLKHLSHLIKAASWLSGLDLPVRLIAIPKGARQGFNDEVLDLDHLIEAMDSEDRRRPYRLTAAGANALALRTVSTGRTARSGRDGAR
jgi:hypothetical protein